MKNTKKLIVTLIAIVLCLATVFAFVACDNDDAPTEKQTFEIKMWVSEIDGIADQFQAQVAAFNASQDLYEIKATISGVSEGESATQMISDVETGADIFCFAQDQLSRLVQAGALQYLGTSAAAAVRETNDASAVACATIRDKIYAYPLTADNGYFMYYDKSIVSEDHIGRLDDIIADCIANDKLISFNLGGSGWYSASFFFGAGCKSSWTTPDGKTFTGVDDTYNSDAGLIAIKGLSAFMNSKVYNDSAETSDFQKDSAVVISGTWGSKAAQTALGDNYGVAKLPCYTVDGKDYQLGSYNGSKLLGVKPSKDLERSKAIQALATYLTNEENQLARYTEFGWGPSNKVAQANEAVASDIALGALAKQNVYAVPQGNIPGSWWDITKTLAAAALKANGNEDSLKAALVAYNDAISALADPDYVPGKDATIIGNMFGDSSWTIDHAMTKANGLWISDYPIYCAEGDEFKIRFGATWDNGEFGDGAGNYKVAQAGLYWIKANEEEKIIELVPASFGVVGLINGQECWDADVVMQDVDGVMTANVTLASNDAIKVRVDAQWSVNYGEGGLNGDNIAISDAGDYVVTMTFDTEKLVWVVNVNAAA